MGRALRAVWPYRTPAALLALGVLLLLTSCGGGSESGEAAGEAPSPAPAESPEAARTIAANETEFAIALSESPSEPGTYTFVAENQGNIEHALTIQGAGVEGASTSLLAPGGAEQLTVDLQAGTYELYCPVAGHREQGMAVTIQVGEARSPGATTGEEQEEGGDTPGRYD